MTSATTTLVTLHPVLIFTGRRSLDDLLIQCLSPGFGGIGRLLLISVL